VVVLRVYFHDYADTSRYSQAQIQTFFSDINTLWGTHSSYGNFSITARVSTLFQLPGNRSDYIDTPPDSGGDLSSGGKFNKVLTDAIAASPSGIDWTNVSAVLVVMAETNPANFHRGQGTKCNLPMGPGSSNTPLVGCAIFSENPSQTDAQVWGRFAHEIGHAFQRTAFHPSNYNSAFEQMDANYPGQTESSRSRVLSISPGCRTPSTWWCSHRRAVCGPRSTPRSMTLQESRIFRRSVRISPAREARTT
jgi:hypothetical protein